jgi:hypothetical protein
MLPFTKLALVTCAFYIGISFLLDGAIFGLASYTGIAGVHLTRGGRYIFFGLVWLASFSLAWRIVMTPLFARIPK